MKFQHACLGLLVLQGLALTYSRRLRQQTLQSQSNGVPLETDRFAALYHGKNWAEVTHLPRGWEIIDFGSSNSARSQRFQQTRNKLNAPGEETGNLRCVETSDGKIKCGPPPPSKDPDHGIDEDQKQQENAAISSPDKEPSPPSINVAPLKPSPLKPSAPAPAPPSAAQKNAPSQSAAPQNAPSQSAASQNPPPQNQPLEKENLPQKDVKKDAKLEDVKKDAKLEDVNKDAKAEEKELVVGGGVVIVLEANPSRVRNANRLIEDNKNLKLQKMPAVTMDQVDVGRDLALSAHLKDAEIACAKSHINAIKKVADPANQPRDALWFIFEDDVQLKPNFLEQVIQNVKALNRPWDILNTWLMPPRHVARGGSGGNIGQHWVIADGYWGMQGYVLTPDSAERLLKCLDPPSHKVWAQVDEMVGCCAAASKTEAFTRCVYHTHIPNDIPLDIHVYCMTPALLVHMDRVLGSYAHRRKQLPLAIPRPPVLDTKGVTGIGLLQEVKKEIPQDVKDVESKIKELEIKMEGGY